MGVIARNGYYGGKKAGKKGGARNGYYGGKKVDYGRKGDCYYDEGGRAGYYSAKKGGYYGGKKGGYYSRAAGKGGNDERAESGKGGRAGYYGGKKGGIYHTGRAAGKGVPTGRFVGKGLTLRTTNAASYTDNYSQSFTNGEVSVNEKVETIQTLFNGPASP